VTGHRGTIFVESGRVLAQHAHPGGQFVLRLEAPECARHASAGQFAHVRCAPQLPMRRPLSIMRADPEAGWIELLYKTTGIGLTALADARPGDTLSVLGPVGRGFVPRAERPRIVMVGGGVGIPPLVFLAEQLSREGTPWIPTVFFGSELPFPFATAPSALDMPGTGPDAGASLELLESLGVPARLASNAELAGCFRGLVTELAARWLEQLPGEELARCELFACGPGPMLRAAQALARQFELPSQLCLEEYMACAVGGCAGCGVRVETPDGPAMRRVCVDGPVFDGYAVYPVAGARLGTV